jgi:hypothetical protein
MPKYAEVAQLVEHIPEEDGVASSSLALGTKQNTHGFIYVYFDFLNILIRLILCLTFTKNNSLAHIQNVNNSLAYNIKPCIIKIHYKNSDIIIDIYICNLAT